MKNKINNPHDKFFRENFSRQSVVRSFVKEYLLKRTGINISLDGIESVQNDSIDSHYFEFFSDLIYCTEILPSKKKLLLLFEHKSFQDPEIGFQLDEYMHVVRNNYSKLHPELKRWINIIPVVIYHGVQNWNNPLSTMELYEKIDNNQRYTPDFRYELFDVTHMKDEQIIGSAHLRITFLTLKYIHSLDLLEKIDDILVIFGEPPSNRENAEYIYFFTNYIENAAKKEIRQKAVEKIIDYFKNGEEKMPIFEEFLNEYIEKGLEKGLEKGRKIGEKIGEEKGIEKGSKATLLITTTDNTDTKISEETGLSIKKVKELRDEIKKRKR